jgi:outer membrane murein-binding lipoprotein Lpp
MASLSTNRAFTGIFSVFLGLFLLAGCIIVINQPSSQEKELLAIQDTVGKQVSGISQKVASGSYDPVEVNDLIAQAQNTVAQAIQRINELKIPEKTQKIAQQTIVYLESCKKIFNQLKDLIADFDRLKQEGIKLSERAGAVVKEQLKSIENSINNFSGQLNDLAKSLDTARTQILQIYNQATK